MGIGMVAAVSAQDTPTLQSALPEETWVIGEVTSDASHQVELR